MIKIKISTSISAWPLIRQTPGSNGLWEDCHFFIDDDTPNCDIWVVYDDIPDKKIAKCRNGCLVFMTAEPPEIRQYPDKFLRQFDLIVTNHPNIKGPNVIHSQTALPWYVGWDVNTNERNVFNKNYDELSLLGPQTKSKLISSVLSRKTKTAGHRQRLEFISKLKEKLGDKFDVYGAKFNQIADKWDAIAPYSYHLSLENSTCKDYWTEKIADAYLGDSYPIYFGCPNITEYFPEDSLSVIDIYKPDQAIEKISEIINGRLYEKSIESRKNARDLILNHYQMFPFISRIVKKMPIKNTYGTRAVYPQSHFSGTLIGRVKSKIKRIINL
jgi:hypothetical protein